MQEHGPVNEDEREKNTRFSWRLVPAKQAREAHRQARRGVKQPRPASSSPQFVLNNFPLSPTDSCTNEHQPANIACRTAPLSSICFDPRLDTTITKGMPAKLQLGDKEVSYSEVKEDESNVLAKFAVWDRRNSFFSHLDRHRARIQATVAHHLGLNVRECHMAEYDDWLYGSFNLCIPVSISSWKTKPTKRVIMRFPLPYKLGGLENADEKLRCEAGTYIWLQQNCPSVPIPRLHGVGFSTGQKVRPGGTPTRISNLLTSLLVDRH